MNIEIKDGEEYENTIHALKTAIRYVNNRLKDGIGSPQPENRSTIWWTNFMSDIKIAETLSSLLDKLRKD